MNGLIEKLIFWEKILGLENIWVIKDKKKTEIILK